METLNNNDDGTLPENEPVSETVNEEKEPEEETIVIGDVDEEGEEEIDLRTKQLMLENAELKAKLSRAVEALTGAQPWHPWLADLKI